MKIEISLKDFILFVLVLVLFIYCFMSFRTYKMEIGLAQRHALIQQNDQNVQILDKNVRDHDARLKKLEALIKE